MFWSVGLFDRFRRGPWSLAQVRRPWGDRPSIYEHVRARLDPQTGRMPAGAEPLPDGKDDGAVRWAAGALDGVMGHHAGPGDEKLRVRQLVKAIHDVLTSATESNLEHLHRLSKESLLRIVDQMTDALEAENVDAGRLHELGSVLAREAPDRETVKLGIALMGMVRGPDDTDLLMELGSHEEFTLFCAVALGRQSSEPERRLWELARRVEGWGRIQIVERLAETNDEEIRAWMLREGFRNSVMDEYLAYTCATAGHLVDALRAAQIDDALLEGAAGILTALARGGPAEDLADYAHAEVVVASWLAHVRRHAFTLEIIEALDALHGQAQLSNDLKEEIEQLRSGEAAHRVIMDGLSSSDDATFGRADQAAKVRGIATFEHHVARFRELRGAAGYHLFRLVEDADESRIDAVLELVATRIDLEKMATGPGKELGVGPGSEPYHLLDTVLHGLSRFPQRGVPFLLAGLRSPVVRNRNMALRTLSDWGAARWSNEIRRALEQAARAEPDDDVKVRCERVLGGGRYDEVEPAR
jgi:hypothetical protein